MTEPKVHTQRHPVCSCGCSITSHNINTKGERTRCDNYQCPCTTFEHTQDWVWQHTSWIEPAHTDDHGSQAD